MGIKIAHDPVATPILASYATGVGRAREREKQRSLAAMEKERDRMYQTQMEFQRRTYQEGRDKANRNFQTERDKANNKAASDRLEQQNKMYRDKDALAALEDAIKEKEKFIGGANLDAQGKTYRDRFYADIAGVRGSRDSSRPDAYYQRLGKVLKKYEDTPWDAHTVVPKTTSSFASEDAVYYDEGGRPMTYEEARTRGAASVMFPGTKPGEFKVNSIGGRSSSASGQKKSISDMTEQEFFADPDEFDRAQKQAVAMLKAQQGIDSGPITQDQIWGAMKGIYEKRRGPVQQGQSAVAPQPTIGQKGSDVLIPPWQPGQRAIDPRIPGHTPGQRQVDVRIPTQVGPTQQEEAMNARAADIVNKYAGFPIERLNPAERKELADAEAQLNAAKKQLFQGNEQVANTGGGTMWEQTMPQSNAIGADPYPKNQPPVQQQEPGSIATRPEPQEQKHVARQQFADLRARFSGEPQKLAAVGAIESIMSKYPPGTNVNDWSSLDQKEYYRQRNILAGAQNAS